MKATKFIGLATIALAAVSAQAQSNNGIYGEVGYTSVNYSEPGYSLSPAGVIRVSLGKNFSDNLALEAIAGFAATDGSLTTSGVTVKGRVDSMYGFYIKPQAQLSDSVSVFGRLGWVSSKLTATAPGVSISSSGSDVSYGVGASVKVAKNAAITFDYMTYYNKSGTKADGITAGVSFGF